MLFYAKQAVKKRWARWVNRRIPMQESVILDQRSIFILPSQEGVIYSITVLALFVGGINYVNSLILAMTFFLTSLMLVVILHTYRNLQGLVVSTKPSEPGFVGDFVRYTIVIENHKKEIREGIIVQLSGAAEIRYCVEPHQENLVNIFVPANQRGVQKPGRLLIKTTYPLGILKAWSWIDLNLSGLVYPLPIQGDMPKSNHEAHHQILQRTVSGVDDFVGLANYQPGDALSKVYWKVLARGLPLATKSFEQPASESCWISMACITGALEYKLSVLTFWVLKLSESRVDFGLDLGVVQVMPGKGVQHKNKCLEALSLYGVASDGAHQTVELT